MMEQSNSFNYNELYDVPYNGTAIIKIGHVVLTVLPFILLESSCSWDSVNHVCYKVSWMNYSSLQGPLWIYPEMCLLI